MKSILLLLVSLFAVSSLANGAQCRYDNGTNDDITTTNCCPGSKSRKKTSCCSTISTNGHLNQFKGCCNAYIENYAGCPT